MRRDYFKQRFTRDELASVLERAGLRPHDVLSTRSRAYRSMQLAERDLSDDELLDLMIQEPTLLRRPLVISPAGTVVGFNKQKLEELTDAEVT